MMLYPDFYKVGVSGAGSMDLRGLGAQVLDKYQGEPGANGELHAPVAIKQLAPRLRGKLLLVYGDMDENVNSAVILQYADALVKANKDFDLLALANYPHTFLSDPYYLRRQIDYFVRYLMGSEPPEGFSFAAP